MAAQKAWEAWPTKILRGVRTQQEHLDFVSLHHLVPLQLVLNLLISSLPLLIFRAHSTPHFGCSLVGTVREKSNVDT